MIDLYRAGRMVEILGRPAGVQYEVFLSYDEAVAWAGEVSAGTR
jgi:hypothetical protein